MASSYETRENFEISYLVALIQWLRTNARRELALRPDEGTTLRDRYGFTKSELAHAFNTRIPIIEKFLYYDPSRGTPTGTALQHQADHFAASAWFLLTQHRRAELPPPVLHAMEQVYLSDFNYNHGPIKNRDVVSFKSLSPQKSQADLSALYGLQLLVRMSTETVAAPELGPEVKISGISISLLNVIHPTVQRGLYHPLFKLYQRGLAFPSINVIEGVVYSQEQSIYFEGIDDRSRCPLLAWTRASRDPYERYRRDPSAYLQGVMVGVSSTGYNFSGVFEMFPLMHDMIEDSFDTDMKELYNKAIETIGVYNFDDAVQAIRKLGVGLSENEIDSTLRSMMQVRSRDRHLYIA